MRYKSNFGARIFLNLSKNPERKVFLICFVSMAALFKTNPRLLALRWPPIQVLSESYQWNTSYLLEKCIAGKYIVVFRVETHLLSKSTNKIDCDVNIQLFCFPRLVLSKSKKMWVAKCIPPGIIVCRVAELDKISGTATKKSLRALGEHKLAISASKIYFFTIAWKQAFF